MSFHTRTRLAVTAIITSAVVTSAVVTSAVVASTMAAPAALAGTMASAGGTIVAPAAAAKRPGGAVAPRDGFIRPPCAVASARTEQCFLEYRPQTAVNRAISAGQTGRAASPKGWSPQAIRSAYNLPARRHSRQTVAVSIAFNTPRLAHFLRVYRKHYGLPRCTVASGCFRKVNQRGNASPLPPSGVNTGWDLEATLDVSMISVACPHCHIVVVEANSPGVGSLAKTEGTAARLGAGQFRRSARGVWRAARTFHHRR